ncbi:putative cyclin-dependent kinase 5 [Schizophyllum commune]
MPTGQGTFGTVYKGRCRRTVQIVALKAARSHKDTSVSREMNVLRRFLHVNIVRLNDVIGPEDMPTLILEFCDNDLQNYMRQYGNQGALDQNEALAFMHQLLEGTAFCHRNGIMHRDLKPQNLLVDSDGILKLADFGSALRIGDPGARYTHILQKMREVSPEIREQPVSSTAHRGRPLGQIVPKAKPKSIDLLSRLLMCNPTKRITAEKALWLTGAHLFKQYVAPSAYVQSQARPRVRFGGEFVFGYWQTECNMYRPPAWG